jgi:hypothetical protein
MVFRRAGFPLTGHPGGNRGEAQASSQGGKGNALILHPPEQLPIANAALAICHLDTPLIRARNSLRLIDALFYIYTRFFLHRQQIFCDEKKFFTTIWNYLQKVLRESG